MNTKTFLGLSVLGVFVLFVSPIGLADATAHFLNIIESEQKVDAETVSTEIKTEGKIPKKGEEALGYGILTSEGDIIVATTHAGVLDSEIQKGNINNPAWHNHYVSLGDNMACDGVPAVVNLSYESPGDVKVKGKKIELNDVPFGPISDIHFGLAPNSITSFDVGEPTGELASFTLTPKFDETGLPAVCVTDLQIFP